MAVSQAVLGYGTLLQRGDISTPTNFVSVLEVRTIDGLKLTKDTKDVTHMESPNGYREHIGALKDGGEVTYSVNFVPSHATQDHLTGVLYDYGNNIRRYWREVLPTVPPYTITYLAEVTAFNLKPPVDDAITADVTLKVTGAPSFA